MSLCGPCLRVFRGEEPLTAGTYYDHHLSWTSFVAAAEVDRCDICWRRFDALSPRQRECLRKFAALVDETESGMAASAAGLSIGKEGYVKIDFTYNLAVEAMNQAARGRITFDMQKELDAISDFLLTRCQKLHFLPADIGKDLVRPVQAKNTSSDSTWELVQSWLGECKAGHRRCAERRGVGSSKWYPTRVLDVDALEPETFRIVDGGDCDGSDPGYISLSHRWGSAEMPRLTVANMASYRAGGAAIAGLPQTFQNAIAVTRRLGARYIWIDSLCIIQEGDGGEDWRREAPQMADVYSKCLLNISADWGGGDQGLFFDRESDFSEKFEIELFFTAPSNNNEDKDEDKDENQERKRERGVSKVTYTYIPAYNLEQVDDSPLAGRGWVFQERILSPVILHFGRREVLWECCEKLASESLPRGLENIPLTDMGSLSQSATLKRLDPEDDPHLRRLLAQAFGGGDTPSLSPQKARDITPYLLWWFLVGKYARCALTFTSDRLVAVSGVARYFRDVIQDQYVLGMWRKYLVFEMAWKVKATAAGRGLDHVSGKGKKAKKYPGPSFSWTSVEGLIDPMNPVYDTSMVPYVEVEPVEVTGEGDGASVGARVVDGDFFGPLTEPCVRIRVKGALKSAEMELTDRGQWLVVPTDISGSYPPSLTSEEWEENATFQQGVRALLDFVPSAAEVQEFQEKIFFYMLWYSHDHETGHCFMLFEQQGKQQEDDGESEETLFNAENVEFRRIGIFRPTGFGAGALTEELLREQTGKALLPGYDEASGCHIIYLV